MACNAENASGTKAHQALLAWYHAEKRQLPWRETDEPYRIWLSEIMLQQTQVKTVLPRYTAWLQHFPTLASVAAADESEILRMWQGLGYYRRARMLHQSARLITQQYGGCFPDTFDAIHALPGVGRSTAGAIASICFGIAAPVLDGNVRRVIQRWHALHDAGDKRLWQAAQEAIDTSDAPADWNQAMMELGATLCQARQTRCAECPLRTHCAGAGTPLRATTTKPPRVRDLHWRIHIHRHPQHGIWVEQRPKSEIWGGLWTPPIEPFELDEGNHRPPDLIHRLTHRRLHLYAVHTETEPKTPGRWAAPDAVAMPTGIRRLLDTTEG